MTIMQDKPMETGQCPVWCQEHVYDEQQLTHVHRVGYLGVRIERPDGDDEPFSSGTVYVPELDADPLHASENFARALGADLTEAAGWLRVQGIYDADRIAGVSA